MNGSDTETTIVNAPSDCYFNKGIKSMSNIDLGMHTIPPRIITKDASYSFIWIDDHLSNFKKQEKSHDEFQRKKSLSKRGCCNLFTILFIILMILFLFLYPFITFFYNSSTPTSS